MVGLWTVKDGLWVEAEPGVYHHEGSGEVALFRVQQGQIVLLEGNYPQGAYVKLPWYGAHSLHGLLWVTAGLAFLATIAVGMVRRVLRRVARAPGPTTTGWPGQLVELMSLSQLLLLLGLLALLAMFGAALAATAVLGQVWVWQRRAGRPGARMFQSSVATLGVLLSLSLGYWRVLPSFW